jgi:ABC-type polar amino acid transport system ATPase subunit
MANLQHIRLGSHKGLQSARLTDLGRINIVCGPNNSGKTTILECIARPSLHVAGLKISDAIAKSIAEEGVRGGVGWGGKNQALNQQYIEAVKKGFSVQSIWFRDEFQKLIESVDWTFAGNWGNPEGNLGPSFQKRFPDHPPSVLIPAKRRLETSNEVHALHKILPEGDGILGFLFRAKNQDESSADRKSFEEIKVGFQEISSGYDFDIFFSSATVPPTSSAEKTNHTVVELRFRRKGANWIPASDCGLGLQELLIVLYFALASEHEMVLVEEPENHLHPEIQRRLIAFLRERTKKQFFLSTHSSVFLNTQFADRVFTCRMTDSVHIENATSRAAALTELGYSIADNLVSDLVVLCEGPKDKLVLDEFFQKMGLLDRANIKVWPLGGDIMGQVDLSVFQESHKLIALLDGDPGSSAVRKRFVSKCEEQKIHVTRLKRYSLENYFSVAAIASVMKGQMPAGIMELKPNERVSDQLGFEVKNNGGRITKEMKLEDIKGTDFEEFLMQVESLLD